MNLTSSSLKIAIQKSGRLTKKSISLLRHIGLNFEYTDKKLASRCQNFDLDILFLRDNDIPEYCQDKTVDLGIVGLNILKEEKPKVKILEKLGFGKCSLEIAVPKNSSIKKVKDLNQKRIATSYPNSLKDFLKKNNLQAELIPLRGSVEIAPALGVADAICDLVSTGSTLKTNNLISIENVLDSECVLICNSDSYQDKNKKKEINRLLMRIRSYQKAKQSKYIMMNAPAKALDKIKKILPGLESPTVLPLAKEGMIAIHSVVAEDVFWEVIEKLKEVGATGILVSPIEKMIA